LNNDITTKHYIRILDTELILSSMVYWDSASPLHEATVCILPIWYHIWDDEGPVVRGLVLKSISGSDYGQYERMGMFALDLDSIKDLNILLHGSQTLKAEQYEEHTCTKQAGKEHHSYTIILL
jgi:hypothetical protein